MVVKENKNIKKAMTALERISLDPVEREKYESVIQAEFLRRISEKRLKEKAIAEGEAKGRTETTIKITKKLLAKKVPLEEIIEITGLTTKEIQKIIEH